VATLEREFSQKGLQVYRIENKWGVMMDNLPVLRLTQLLINWRYKNNIQEAEIAQKAMSRDVFKPPISFAFELPEKQPVEVRLFNFVGVAA
jgi:hypothetical protein